MKVGLLGCGNIGYAIGKALVSNLCPGKELAAICNTTRNEKVEALLKVSALGRLCNAFV